MSEVVLPDVFGIEGLDVEKPASGYQVGDKLVNEEEMNRLLTTPGEVSVTAPTKSTKRALHRSMRRLGIGKHAGGNAQTLANHKRVPGEIAVGQTKTLAQVRADKAKQAKRKNKMARQSRKRNRR